MKNPLLDAALRYRSAGLSIIPLIAGSKYPDPEAVKFSGNLDLLGRPSWKVFYRRLATDAEIESWFAVGNRNLGILTGNSDLLALDFDDPKSYEDWFSRNKTLAARTCIQKTPRGFHVFLRWAQVWSTRLQTGVGFKFAGSRSRRAGELKGADDWVAAWPSVRSGGRHYEWLRGQAPWETEIVRIGRLEDIGIDPLRKIPDSYVTFVRNFIADPRTGLPLLVRWVRHRYSRARGVRGRWY